MKNGLRSMVKQKLGEGYSYLTVHWNTPPLGRYVSFKEIAMYSVGGMGKEFMNSFLYLFVLSSSSFLIGATIGIKPMDLQYMSIASTIIGFGTTVIRSYLIDNSKFKSGKFRPWLATMGIPTLIFSIIFVWLPYETMSYSQKVLAVLICFNLIQVFSPMYTQAYTDLLNVLSPNSYERTDIATVSSVIYSIAPTLSGLLLPWMSTLTGGLTSITTYRIIYPIVAFGGLCISYLAVIGTKERIIVAKSHVSHFKFMDALRAVSKNKYFWITSMAGWIGFLETSITVIVGWTFVYGYPERMGTYGIVQTLIGESALFAMVLSPIAIRVLGKRNLLIWCNVANIVFISMLYPFFSSIPMLAIVSFLNGFANYFSIVYTVGINADMRDYQQWYTGERIDGMFGAVGLIGSFISIFTGLVLPAIYQSIGLHENYDVLEVTSFREDMFRALIIAAIIGAALNCIPYFFYDLTEIKQRSIVKVLKIRALFEDYGNGILSEETLVEAIDIIDEANELQKERPAITTKDDIKKARKYLPARNAEEKAFRKEEIARLKQQYRAYTQQQSKHMQEMRAPAKALPKATKEEKTARKAAMKAARKEVRAYKNQQKEISVCDFVIDEMNKFETRRVQAQVARAERVVQQGLVGIYSIEGNVLKQAKSLPRTTQEEREIRSDAAAQARESLRCQKKAKRYYPNGIEVPDEAALELAEKLPEGTLTERIGKRRRIRSLVNARSHYTQASKIYLDAKRLLTEQENFQHLDEIRQAYAAGKQYLEMETERKRAELEKIEAEKKQDMEKKRQERLEKKASKKNGGGKR